MWRIYIRGHGDGHVGGRIRLPVDRGRGGRPLHVRPHALGLPARARRDLSDRLPVALGAGERADRKPGDPPRRAVPSGPAGPRGAGALSPRADVVVAGRRGPRVGAGVRRRGGGGGPAHLRRGAGRVPRAALGVVPLAGNRGAGLPLVSVGRAAARGRVPRDLLRPRASPPGTERRTTRLGHCAVPAVVATVPTRVPVGTGEADLARPDVARPDGARLSLLHAAAAHLDGVVRAAASRLVQA